MQAEPRAGGAGAGVEAVQRHTNLISATRGFDLSRLRFMQGHELEAQVQESKLYSDRLAALEAELGEARLAAQEARDRHAKHLAELEPLANKHRHHKVSSPFQKCICR